MNKLVAGFLALIPSVAASDWYAETAGPDVFGEKSAMLIGSPISNTKDALRFDCTGDGKYSIMWMISTGEPMYDVRSLASNIVVKTDKGKASSVSTVTQAWNDDYIASRAENDPAIIAMLKDISEASSKIDVGYVVPDIDRKVSGSINAAGSTFGAKQFMEHCELGK